MTIPDPHTVEAWTSLFRASQALLDGVESELKAHGLPQLSWYDALLEIEKAGADGIRPFELKERLLLPQYGTSRLLDRVAKAGLITREDVETDGRGQIVRLTEKGRDTRQAMWPIYAGALITLIQSRISPSELAELNRLLHKITPARPKA